jgi:hypothetical protein
MRPILLFLFVLVLAPPAHAYLDPGTGSMIVQAIIGAAVTALVAFRFYWDKVKAFVLGKRSEAPDKAD